MGRLWTTVVQVVLCLWDSHLLLESPEFSHLSPVLEGFLEQVALKKGSYRGVQGWPWHPAQAHHSESQLPTAWQVGISPGLDSHPWL